MDRFNHTNEADDDNGFTEEPSFQLSQTDQYIKNLNGQGLSAGQISKSLKSYGIELSKASVLRHITEMRQTPDNGIQVNYKYISRPKSELRWYSIVSRLQKDIPAYTKLMGFKPSSRTLFYQYEDVGLLKPEDQHTFINVTVKARLGWTDSNGELLYPKLDLDCFSDDQRKSVENYDDTEPIEPTEPGPIEDADDCIDYEISRLKKAVKEYDGVGESGEDAEIGGYWYGQPEYVETWEEKNDLIDGFNVILKDRYVNIRANKGYSSLDFLNECTKALKELMERKGLEPKHIHIKYCGDWDPSGLGIDYYIKKRLQQLGISGIDFERVAVTSKQIDEFRLPLMPIGQREGKKKPNPNMKEFKRLYGNKATHLNAFFTKKHLPEFKRIILASIDKHWNQSIYDEMIEEYNDWTADEPERLTNEVLKEKRKMMRDKITEAFKSGWEVEEEKTDEYEEEDEEDE